MERNRLFERVRDLIIAETGAEPVDVVPEARLFEDLGISGDDAESLVVQFANRFQVDLKGFEFSRYFYGEPHLCDLGAQKRSPKEPLTVAELVAAARRGVWATIPSGK